MNVLEIKDRHGKSIKLTAEQWKHILLHKVMSGQLENIRSALEFPETIRQSNTDDGVKFYYKTIKDSPVRTKYLFVSVKYLNGEGFVITAFYTNKMKGDKIR